MKTSARYLALSLIVAAATSLSGFAAELVKQWETPPALLVPESVLYDGDAGLLYVSNVEGDQPWARDGAGSIAKVGLDGKVIQVQWVTGLNAPKGLGLRDGMLYVADIDHVVVIDVAQAKIVRTIAVPGAEHLNDLTIDPAGVVYVSDSQTGRIHAITDGKATVFAEGFQAPNGVLAADGVLYVLDNEALHRVSAAGAKPETIITGLQGHVDGVEQVSDGTFLVSDWNGAVYLAKVGAEPQLLLDTREAKINAADIGYDPVRRIVYVPTFWKNSVAAYALK